MASNCNFCACVSQSFGTLLRINWQKYWCNWPAFIFLGFRCDKLKLLLLSFVGSWSWMKASSLFYEISIIHMKILTSSVIIWQEIANSSFNLIPCLNPEIKSLFLTFPKILFYSNILLKINVFKERFQNTEKVFD